MDLPMTHWVRRSDVLRSNLGVTKYDFATAVDTGELQGTVFPGKTRAKYSREEVLRVFGMGAKRRR